MKSYFYLVVFCFFKNSLPIVYPIGDSHSFFCFMEPTISTTIDPKYNNKIFYRDSNNSLIFKINWLGPVTLYKIKKHLKNFIKQYDFLDCLSEKDILIFSFGEIDCRCHIQKQIVSSNRSKKEIINELVASYRDSLSWFKEKSIQLELKIVILGIMPPIISNDTMPINGTFDDRLETVLSLNTALKEMATSEGYYFLDVYPLCSDDDGSLSTKLYDGFNHLSPVHNHKVWDLLIATVGNI